MGTGYRPPSKEPKGRWARHIHAKRRELGWSQTRGFEAVREGMGLSEKSRAAYIAVDMGDRQPTAKEEAALIAVYGIPEEPQDALEATETPDGLVEAIRAQTAAMLALVEEIRLSRAEELVSREALMTALGAALSLEGMRGGDGHGRNADARP